jgi:hypothetical protein
MAFPGWADDNAVEVRVHEDALLIVADTWTRRLGFSFVDRVTVENNAISLAVAGGTSVLISRLGRRAGELASLVQEQLRESRGRTAEFLGSLLPGLDPMAARAVAALLRDGAAAPTHSLDAIHPEVTATLLRVATKPRRFAAVAALAQHADLAIGFKQAASVRIGPFGGGHGPAGRPHAGLSLGGLGYGGLDLGGLGYGGLGLGGLGYGGPFGGGHDRLGGPDGGLGAYWAYQALGHGINWNASPADSFRPVMPRADGHRGTLTPPPEDLAALAASDSEPTVLAFALFASARGRVAYDALNLPEPVTYVYEADGDARTVINRALDDTGFQAAAVHAAADDGRMAAVRLDAPSAQLAHSLVARIPHGRDWQRQIAGLLS